MYLKPTQHFQQGERKLAVETTSIGLGDETTTAAVVVKEIKTAAGNPQKPEMMGGGWGSTFCHNTNTSPRVQHVVSLWLF